MDLADVPNDAMLREMQRAPAPAPVLVPAALLLGLTHPRDAARCCIGAGCAPAQPRLVLRSCSLQPPDDPEVALWDCSPAAAACGWRRHALAALPQLGVWLQPPPTPLQPAVSVERRLSAPPAGASFSKPSTN
jgi:hypothetical protein